MDAGYPYCYLREDVGFERERNVACSCTTIHSYLLSLLCVMSVNAVAEPYGDAGGE
jgi:hypothetical protein